MKGGRQCEISEGNREPCSEAPNRSRVSNENFERKVSDYTKNC
jgi:hypothetical protein